MGERYCLSCGKPMDTSSATATDCRSCDAQAPLLATIETLEAALERIDELTDAGWDFDLVNSIARNALGRKG